MEEQPGNQTHCECGALLRVGTALNISIVISGGKMTGQCWTCGRKYKMEWGGKEQSVFDPPEWHFEFIGEEGVISDLLSSK